MTDTKNMPVKRKRIPSFVPIIFIVVGLGFMTLATYIGSIWVPHLSAANSLSAKGVKTSGTVMSIGERIMSPAKSDKYAFALIEYGMDGQYYTGDAVLSNKYDVGDSVMITYDPNNTKSISVDDTKGAAIGAVMLVVLIGVLGIGSFAAATALFRSRLL